MKIEIYSKPHCPYCVRAKKLFDQKNLPYTEITVDETTRQELMDRAAPTVVKTVPQIFINDILIGGYDDLIKLEDFKI